MSPPIRAAAGLLLVLAVLAGCHTGARGHTAAPPAGHLTTPAGMAQVQLLAPADHGAGSTPTFRWRAVAGAARYQLFVRDPQGQPIWAWRGTDTSVRLGGLSIDPPPGAPGPRLVAGSTWLVAALGPDGTVRAVSPVRPVSP